jgi:hypothetical protein
MADEHVLVVVDDRHRTTIEDVAARLRATGMRVGRINPRTGTITGTVPVDRRAGLSEVHGVASVRPVRGVRIAPPDADTQ